ncbi:centromere protein I-like [Tigriopus californicus]|uniref:centromere protein I-like n=1 Tax=Tigriopus californicus TaxID=6832 RepID=UPI0027DAA7FA|nr:centromere protein I-like [Tigriopus californicus]
MASTPDLVLVGSDWNSFVRDSEPHAVLSANSQALEEHLTALVPEHALTSAGADSEWGPSLRAWLSGLAWALSAQSQVHKPVKLKNRRLRNWTLILKFITCLERYSLISVADLLPDLFEQLFHLVRVTHGITRTILCELLSSIANRNHAVPWRVRSLKNNVFNSQGVDVKGPVHLLKKFKFLKPDLIPENLSHYPSIPDPVGRPGMSELERKFEAIWTDRNPFNNDLDDLMPDCRLSWDDVIHHMEIDPSDQNSQDGPHIKRCRLALPGPENVNHVDQTSSGAKHSVSLANCTTVLDIYQNLGHIVPPSQSLALLRRKALFMILAANDNPEEVQARFSIALYHTLHNEFFGSIENSLPRKQYILQRVSLLQNFFQQGIPVVSRFLAEFLPNWNGEELFLEVLGLVSHVQITDFEELSECVLTPLLAHFSKKFTIQQQIVTLACLRRLVFHWITLEYERCKNHLKRFFGTANPNCINPLGAIASLIDIFVQYCESGLAQALAESNPLTSMYFHEVLTNMLMVSRCLASYKLPLCLELPPSFIYHALFQSTPVGLSQVLEHISTIKFETIPICQKALKRVQALIDEDNMATSLEAEAEKEVLLEQLKSKDGLNVVTKDIIAILTNDIVYLDRGKSIFRLHWDIEEQSIRKSLNLTNHIAFQPFIWAFLDKSSHEHNLSRQEIMDDLQDENTMMTESFLGFLSTPLPMVTAFLNAFQRPKIAKGGSAGGKSLHSIGSMRSQGQISQKSRGTSTTATSGISSLVPTSVRKSARSKKK